MAKSGFTVSLALTNLLQSINDNEYQFGLMLLNAFINEYSFSNGKLLVFSFEIHRFLSFSE